MKKVLSLVLSVVMCISFMSAAYAAVDVVSAGDFFSINDAYVKDGKITYTISINKGVKLLTGARFSAEFDAEVLKPISCGYVKSDTLDDEGEPLPVVTGAYAAGFAVGSDSKYSIGFINASGITTTASKAFVSFTFEVISDEYPVTKVKFTLDEMLTEDNIDNEITEPLGLKEYEFSTLSVPELIAASTTEAGIELVWKQVPGAESYRVMRYSPETAWETISNTNASTSSLIDCDVESGVKYTYSVAAVNSFGESFSDSSGISCAYLQKPLITSAAAVQGGVALAWTESEGAEGYFVMRKVAGDTAWTQIAALKNQAGTKYTDRNVASGATYEYDIIAVSDTTTTTPSSTGTSVYYLSAPTLLGIKNTVDGINIQWSAVAGASGYTIYRKSVSDTDFRAINEVTDTTYTDINILNANEYCYTVRANNEFGTSGCNTLGLSLFRVMPTSVTSIENGKNFIKIKWAEVDSADGYVIYRKLSQTGEWQKVTSVEKGTAEYKDTAVVSGNVYYYSVSTYVGTSESAKGENAESIFYLKTPGVSSAVNDAGGIKVSWSSCAGAQKYEILRAVEGGELLTLATVSSSKGTTYVDTSVFDGTSYSYAVRALSENGNSYTSDESEVCCRLSYPVVTSLTVLNNGVLIKWDASDAATGYNIYRKTPTTSWVKIKTIANVLSYTDEAVSSGVTYSYIIESFNSISTSCRNTDAAKSVCYLSAPSITAIKNMVNGISVTWSAVSGASSYAVQKRTANSAGAYSSWSTVYTTTNGSTVTFTDKNVKNDTTYQYRVQAQKNDTCASAVSSSKTIGFVTAPTVTSVANVYGGVTVKWNAVSGTVNYIVYRKIKGGSWAVIATVSSTVRTYTDKKPASGTTYYYTVVATDGAYRSNYNAKLIQYIASPNSVSTASTTTGITVKWNKVTGASKYYVYRKVGSATSWTRVATVTAAQYNDKAVKSGTKYTYTVRAVGSSANSSYNPNGWTRVYLSAPKLLSAVSSKTGITVKWAKVAGAAGYYVYRKTGSGGWTKIATVSGNGKVSYVDKKAVKGTTYKYTVRAYGSNYTSSYNSSGIACKDRY